MLDRYIDEAVDTFLNVAAAEAEHPADPDLGEALERVTAQLDRYVRLRSGLGRGKR